VKPNKRKGIFPALAGRVSSGLAAVAFGLLVCSAVAQDKPVEPKPLFKDAREKASYAFGMNLGRGWKKSGVDLDPEVVARALKDALGNGPTLLTETEMNQTLTKFTRELRLVQRQRHDLVAEENRKQGAAFLERNKSGEGVVSLPSGLQYKVLAEGTGQSPALTNWVSLKFRGTRIDGTQFETSYGYPKPNSYSMSAVLPAWVEALQRMKPGSEWRLFVPSELAYGKEGSHVAGPNETVIYDLQLVAVLNTSPKDIRTQIPPDND
jgi:FKBP-type peptidyl-prolyl cis-trans isomerase